MVEVCCNDVRMRILPALAVTLLLLAACGGGDAAEGPTPPVAPLTEAAETQAPAPTEAAPEPTEAEPAPTEATAEETEAESSVPAGSSAVVLEPNALGFTDVGDVTRIEFGQTDKDTAVGALTAALGAPTSQQDGLECGPGALDAVNWGGLSSYYLDGTFAGWFLQDPAPVPMTTANGIGLGSKLGDMRGAYPDITVQETTIGFEFDAGDLFGTLTADSDHDTVVTMWSGANCIAR